MGRQINKYMELSALKHSFLKGKTHSEKGKIPLAQTFWCHLNEQREREVKDPEL